MEGAESSAGSTREAFLIFCGISQKQLDEKTFRIEATDW